MFWAKKGRQKWQVEWPRERIVKSGWYALKSCFERALAEDIPVLNANYLLKITMTDVRGLFRSANNTEVPLLKERQKNLQEAGQVLLEKYRMPYRLF